MSTIYKDIRNNWTTSDDIKLACGRTLRVSTSKVSSGNLVTNATVGVADKNVFSFIMFQDYSNRLACTKPGRCTSRVVAEQHAAALEGIKEEIGKITMFYIDTPLECV